MSKFSSKVHPHIIKKIRLNNLLKLDLCKVLNISPSTLQRWLDNNNPSLTRIDAMTCIAKHLGISIEEVSNMPEYQEQP